MTEAEHFQATQVAKTHLSLFTCMPIIVQVDLCFVSGFLSECLCVYLGDAYFLIILHYIGYHSILGQLSPGHVSCGTGIGGLASGSGASFPEPALQTYQFLFLPNIPSYSLNTRD